MSNYETKIDDAKTKIQTVINSLPEVVLIGDNEMDLDNIKKELESIISYLDSVKDNLATVKETIRKKRAFLGL